METVLFVIASPFLGFLVLKTLQNTFDFNETR